MYLQEYHNYLNLSAENKALKNNISHTSSSFKEKDWGIVPYCYNQKKFKLNYFGGYGALKIKALPTST